MGVVIPTGYAQVSAVFHLAGDAEPMVATFGVDSGAETNPTNLASDICVLWIDADTAYAASSMSNLYTVGPFEATIMTPTGPQTGTGTSSRVGTNSSVLPPPNNVTYLTQKRTDRGGRKGRGRFFQPPANLHEANIDAVGTVLLSIYEREQDWATSFLLALDGAGTPMVLLHSEEAGPIAPDPVTALVVQQKVATQRTRLRR